MVRFYIIGLIFLFCGCSKPQKSVDKLPGDAVILAFGDSLTYGTGASSEHDYPHVLAQLSRREVINEGVPGEISADGLKRLPVLLDEYQPKLLILIHGGNDLLKKIPKPITEKNLDEMIAAAKSRGIQVVLAGVPEPGLILLESSPFYKTIAARNDLLVDLDSLPSILGDNDLKSDLIHPNDEGYRRLATNIYELLIKAGAL
ncbi:MAG: arylesterase [Methylococcaceae bacterium]|nr:arylesterase [Methylococcaceae bacterium]